MEYPNLILSVIILIINAVTAIVFIFNIAFRLKSAVFSDTKEQLDFYFKLVMLSIIGVLLSGIGFYIGVKFWLKESGSIESGIVNIRLIHSVLMIIFALMVSIIDRRYNPFK